jgi:EAL domain-containing protein (putative c-di-GMP-specific phosphodiesterase class I)
LTTISKRLNYLGGISRCPTVDSDDAAIVQTIIAMAHNLGLKVIAEGVETQAQRTFLEQHGCLVYQGYLFSKPVPIDEFESLLTDNTRP